MRILITTLLSIVFSLEAIAQEEAWNFKKVQDSIFLFTRKVEGLKYKSVKTEALVNAEINNVVDFLKRVDLYPQWVSSCYSIDLLARPDSSTFYVYQLSKLAEGKDRGMVVRISFTDNPDSSKVMTQESIDTIIPSKGAVIPIKKYNARLTLTPIEKKTMMTLTIILDPGGDLPAFAVNRGIQKMFLETTANLKAKLQSEDRLLEHPSESREIKGREGP